MLCVCLKIPDPLQKEMGLCNCNGAWRCNSNVPPSWHTVSFTDSFGIFRGDQTNFGNGEYFLCIKLLCRFVVELVSYTWMSVAVLFSSTKTKTKTSSTKIN